ncbi:MAG: Gfo/Idh/MocA family oxidoreductase, partial [Flavobacteriaceae bacterium]|nr:Gfo/Idh/MocA family oxidoreductase [Flavobacteriaceae bacterium]
TFANEYNVPLAYGSYDELLNNQEIDAIYIATPHSHHLENTLEVLSKKKAVLCEKPIAVNYRQVQQMVNAAKKERVLLMEALWTKFLPSYEFVKKIVEERELGEVKSIEANFGFEAEYNPDARLMNKSLAGGSLLDIGIYPIFLALDLLGLPEIISANATYFDTGVDSSVKMTFNYPNNLQAQLYCTLLEKTPINATINFSGGKVIMHSRFHEPTTIEVLRDGKSSLHEFPAEGFGYHYEIEHFNELIRQGKTESPMMSLNKSLELINVLDKVRKEIGLEYPMDKSSE